VIGEVWQSKHPFKPVATAACTADGQRQEVVCRTQVQYKGVVKDIDLHIIPSLSQNLYLRIDFWSSFGLLPSTIDTGDAKPVKRRHFPLSPANEESNSPRSSPIVLV